MRQGQEMHAICETTHIGTRSKLCRFTDNSRSKRVKLGVKLGLSKRENQNPTVLQFVPTLWIEKKINYVICIGLHYLPGMGA